MNLRRYLKMYTEEQAVIAYDDMKGFLELEDVESASQE